MLRVEEGLWGRSPSSEPCPPTPGCSLLARDLDDAARLPRLQQVGLLPGRAEQLCLRYRWVGGGTSSLGDPQQSSQDSYRAFHGVNSRKFKIQGPRVGVGSSPHLTQALGGLGEPLKPRPAWVDTWDGQEGSLALFDLRSWGARLGKSFLVCEAWRNLSKPPARLCHQGPTQPGVGQHGGPAWGEGSGTLDASTPLVGRPWLTSA